MIVYLTISQMLDLLVSGINIALGKPASQSSVASDVPFATARVVVDGNPNNTESMDHNSCSHTKYIGNPKTAWWQVDLQDVYQLTEVKITYRNWSKIFFSIW